MARRKDAEWHRGARFGAAAACEILSKHGRPLAEKNASDLSIDARRRGADSFSKGYAKAYREAVYGNTCKRRR